MTFTMLNVVLLVALVINIFALAFFEFVKNRKVVILLGILELILAILLVVVNL